MTSRLLAGTNNAHKLIEFKRILGPLGIEVVSPSAWRLELDVEEIGATFAENAEIKARAFSEASGLPALADDSGLVVDALGGEPGVYSARYGGPGLTDVDRSDLVLARMHDVPRQRRSARFIAVLALAVPGQEVSLFTGEVEGLIADEAQGRNGFGYDPIFFYPTFGKTFGEATAAEKDTVSHRAVALAKLAEHLRQRPLTVILGRSIED